MHSRLQDLLLQCNVERAKSFIASVRKNLANIQDAHILRQLFTELSKYTNEQKSLERAVDLKYQLLNSKKNLDIHIFYTLDNNINVSFNLYTDCQSLDFKEYLPVGYFQNSIADVEEKSLSFDGQQFLYSITFQLSNSPHLFLSWLSYISIYFFDINLFKFSNIFISGEDQDDIGHNDHLSQLLECILSLARKKPAFYALVIEAIEKLDVKNMESSFFVYQLNNYPPDNAPNITRAIRVNTLCTLSKELIESGQKYALNTYFRWMDLYLKYKIYASAIDKLSPSGIRYGFQNQQWQLLKFADFKYINNTICITNIENNDAYKALYADNCVLNNKYEQNIHGLLEMLDLEFDSQSDLRSHIILQPQTTRKLLASGFCLKDECQRTMYKENNWKLFSTKIENKNERMAPYFCPKVIVEEIFDIVHQNLK